MIRLYTPEDLDKVVNLIKLNIPHYFAESEEKDLILYLNNAAENYLVVEQEGEIIGAGGINYFIAKRQAYLSWDMIHPVFQGQGIGSQLTQYRIEQIRKNSQIRQIIVRTSQLVYPFYEKLGFALQKTEKDFWAKGFDLYHMVMDIKTPGIYSNQNA